MGIKTPLHMLEALKKARADGRYRVLAERSNSGVDFCSNDYLGLSKEVARSVEFTELLSQVEGQIGATGSRLVSGTTESHVLLEEKLAQFFRAEAALFFGSGYEANLALMSCIGSRGDTIIFDKNIHASMRDGIRLSQARSYSFRHNDLEDLRSKVANANGEVFVAVESLYSMDGDIAPLDGLCRLSQEMGFKLVVDEAHSTGIFGSYGEGLVCEYGQADICFARVHTFGKAAGYKGACIVGGTTLKDYLINFSRPFIYSTAPDLITIALIQEVLVLLRAATDRRKQLVSNIALWGELVGAARQATCFRPGSPVQVFKISGNEAVMAAQELLERASFLVKGIRSPTVPEGAERIRICLHNFNSTDDIRRLWELLQNNFLT